MCVMCGKATNGVIWKSETLVVVSWFKVQSWKKKKKKKKIELGRAFLKNLPMIPLMDLEKGNLGIWNFARIREQGM